MALPPNRFANVAMGAPTNSTLPSDAFMPANGAMTGVRCGSRT